LLLLTHDGLWGAIGQTKVFSQLERITADYRSTLQHKPCSDQNDAYIQPDWDFFHMLQS